MIREVFTDFTMEDLLQLYLQKEEELRREAQMLKAQQENLAYSIEGMKQFQSCGNQIHFGIRPALLRLSFLNFNDGEFRLIEEKRQQRQLRLWQKYSAIEFLSGRCSVADLLQGQTHFTIGLCVNYSVALASAIDQKTEQIAECPALEFYCKATPELTLEDWREPLMEFASAHQIRLIGDCVTRVLFSQWNNSGEYEFYHLAWIPYEKL